VLVLAHRQDPIHRFAFGEVLARAIPGARLVELTPKSIARERHVAEVQGCLDAFLSQFLAWQTCSKDATNRKATDLLN
jgi:hypothetical protein